MNTNFSLKPKRKEEKRKTTAMLGGGGLKSTTTLTFSPRSPGEQKLSVVFSPPRLLQTALRLPTRRWGRSPDRAGPDQTGPRSEQAQTSSLPPRSERTPETSSDVRTNRGPSFYGSELQRSSVRGRGGHSGEVGGGLFLFYFKENHEDVCIRKSNRSTMPEQLAAT